MTTGEHSFCCKFSASTAIYSTVPTKAFITVLTSVLTAVYCTVFIAVFTMDSRVL